MSLVGPSHKKIYYKSINITVKCLKIMIASRQICIKITYNKAATNDVFSYKETIMFNELQDTFQTFDCFMFVLQLLN